MECNLEISLCDVDKYSGDTTTHVYKLYVCACFHVYIYPHSKTIVCSIIPEISYFNYLTEINTVAVLSHARHLRESRIQFRNHLVKHTLPSPTQAE